MTLQKEGELPRRAGIQADGTYFGRILHTVETPDGKIGFFPPNPGESINTKRGAFLVQEIVRTGIDPNGLIVYWAKGELVPRTKS